MRIWHKQLIPKLCRQHLLAVWREGLGCYKILTENKKGYRNHPAVKEFENGTYALYLRLTKIREEMLKRGYRPKPLPVFWQAHFIKVRPWQTLSKQIEVLRAKQCECKV